MGRIFKSRKFAKAARKSNVTDAALKDAVENADAGLVAAYLGGDPIKLRIPREGEGKSGGFRTILAYRQAERAFFIHIFAKNDAENVKPAVLEALRFYGEELIAAIDEKIERNLGTGALMEIL